jgi:hypothetical protein
MLLIGTEVDGAYLSMSKIVYPGLKKRINAPFYATWREINIETSLAKIRTSTIFIFSIQAN